MTDLLVIVIAIMGLVLFITELALYDWDIEEMMFEEDEK